MGGIGRRRDQSQARGRPADLRSWVLPHWLRHQLSATSSPLDVGGDGREGRTWTPLGLPDDEARWTLDASGALASAMASWSIDWWVGADDRWYAPSMESAVRQRLIGAAPVVETRMWVPGGDIVATHWATPSPSGPPVVCLDIANAGTAGVALAVALRPWGPLGVGRVRRITLEADRLRAEGEVVLWAEAPPRHAAFSRGSGGDVSALVFANAATAAFDTEIVDAGGWATAALIWPLVARATLRFEIGGGAPVTEVMVKRRELDRRRGAPPDRIRPAPRPAGAPARGEARPTPDEVARGWTARVDRSTRLDLPPGALATSIAVARRRLLLASEPADAAAGGLGSATVAGSAPRCEAALTVAALASGGCRHEAAVRLGRWLQPQGHGGPLGGGTTATSATLWALGRWAETGPDDDNLIARASIAVTEATEAVGAARVDRSALIGGSALTDMVWTVAGLRSASALLARLDEARAASDVARWADARAEALTDGLRAVQAMTATVSDGASPAVDDLIRAGLLGVQLGVVTDAGATAARQAAGASGGAIGVAFGGSGRASSPYLTLLVAVSSIRARADPSAALAWVLSVAGPTWTWPRFVPGPHRAGRSPGDDAFIGDDELIGDAGLIGDDPLVSVGWWALGRALLVDDQAAAAPPLPVSGPARLDGGAPVRLTLFPWMPDDWLGQPVEVHGLATTAGRASWALRWHGRRPALLWELEGDGPDVELRAPGIDAEWSGRGRRGEALLVGTGLVGGPGGGAGLGL